MHFDGISNIKLLKAEAKAKSSTIKAKKTKGDPETKTEKNTKKKKKKVVKEAEQDEEEEEEPIEPTKTNKQKNNGPSSRKGAPDMKTNKQRSRNGHENAPLQVDGAKNKEVTDLVFDSCFCSVAHVNLVLA